MRRRRQVLALVVPLACLAAWAASRVGLTRGDDGPDPRPEAPDARTERRADRGAKTWTTAVEPKPLSRNVKKGLDWLVEHQLPGGGWGEGDWAWRLSAGFRGEPFREIPDVADTCIASLALIRSGSTPREGPYRGAICDGVGYVRTQVEESDARSLDVTSVYDTVVQMKLGPNIDTYLASMLLAEVKGKMPDEASERAVDLALDKVIGTVERRYEVNHGPFEGQGWAPILAQAMSAKGLNRARQAGVRVSEIALAQAEDAARIACRTGSWPRAMSRPMAVDSTGSGPGVSRRLRLTDGVPPASVGSSRSTAADAGDGEAGRGSLSAAASPAPPSSAGRMVRYGESAGRRSLLGGDGTARPTPAAREGEDAGRRSMLASDAPAPAPAAAGDAARDGEDAGRPTELSAAGPLSPVHRHRKRIGAAAGNRGRMGMGEDADVELYSRAACLGILQDSLNTGRAEVPRLSDLAAHSRDPKRRAEAEKKLAQIADAEKVQPRARAAVVARLDDPPFLAGVGVKGGEEFLSYMTIAESLVVRGDDAWRRWDSRMAEDLYRVQDADGSWSGFHCITGRTFSTAAALLTLMADRAPVPVPARETTSSSYSR